MPTHQVADDPVPSDAVPDHDPGSTGRVREAGVPVRCSSPPSRRSLEPAGRVVRVGGPDDRVQPGEQLRGPRGRAGDGRQPVALGLRPGLGGWTTAPWVTAARPPRRTPTGGAAWPRTWGGDRHCRSHNAFMSSTSHRNNILNPNQLRRYGRGLGCGNYWVVHGFVCGTDEGRSALGGRSLTGLSHRSQGTHDRHRHAGDHPTPSGSEATGRRHRRPRRLAVRLRRAHPASAGASTPWPGADALVDREGRPARTLRLDLGKPTFGRGPRTSVSASARSTTPSPTCAPGAGPGGSRQWPSSRAPQARPRALGVVTVIAPWNYPVQLAIQPMVAAVRRQHRGEASSSLPPARRGDRRHHPRPR